MRKLILLCLMTAFVLVGCDKNKVEATAKAQTTAEATTQNADGEEAAESTPAADTTAKADQVEDSPAAAAPPTEIEVSPELLDPSKATEEAPAKYKVKFSTTKGDFVAEIDRSLAPKGADRLYNLVKLGYYDNVAFFRVIDGFMAQFGIHGAPQVNKTWREARIQDDPVKGTNSRGTITFATAGPNTRTTQLFINFRDNKNLDGMGFAPIGKIDDEGMKVVDSLYKGYGEGAPRGRGPSQALMQEKGNSYLAESFPELDYIKSATIVE